MCPRVQTLESWPALAVLSHIKPRLEENTGQGERGMGQVPPKQTDKTGEKKGSLIHLPLPLLPSHKTTTTGPRRQATATGGSKLSGHLATHVQGTGAREDPGRSRE